MLLKAKQAYRLCTGRKAGLKQLIRGVFSGLSGRGLAVKAKLRQLCRCARRSRPEYAGPLPF